jgi:hypothetical protein
VSNSLDNDITLGLHQPCLPYGPTVVQWPSEDNKVCKGHTKFGSSNDHADFGRADTAGFLSNNTQHQQLVNKASSGDLLYNMFAPYPSI